ncbi:hypothetical protein GQX74_000345 [Glossina fuscipes]|nr:hypothetical protein GQX74_000345 [Glossina fuscipes]
MLPSIPRVTHVETIKSTSNISLVKCNGSTAACSGSSCCASHNYAIELSTKTKLGNPQAVLGRNPHLLTILEDVCLDVFLDVKELKCLSNYRNKVVKKFKRSNFPIVFFPYLAARQRFGSKNETEF